MPASKKGLAPEPRYEIISPGRESELTLVVVPERHQVLRVTLSTGRQLDVELWERVPGELQIRGNHGAIVVKPHSSNLIYVTTDK